MSNDGRKGSVRRAPNGSWHFVADVALPGAPRDQRRKRGFRTKREAQAALTELLSSVHRREYVPFSRQTVGQFLVEDWLPALRGTVRPATSDSYARNVQLHVLPHSLGQMHLQDVDGPTLNRLYAQLRQPNPRGRVLSDRSIAYVHAILHRAFRDAVKWQRMARNPCEQSDPPTQGEQAVRPVYTASELRTFLRAVSDQVIPQLDGG